MFPFEPITDHQNGHGIRSLVGNGAPLSFVNHAEVVSKSYPDFWNDLVKPASMF